MSGAQVLHRGSYMAQDHKPDCMISVLFRSQFPVSCPSKVRPVSERLSGFSVFMPVAILLLAEELSLKVKQLECFKKWNFWSSLYWVRSKISTLPASLMRPGLDLIHSLTLWVLLLQQCSSPKTVVRSSLHPTARKKKGTVQNRPWHMYLSQGVLVLGSGLAWAPKKGPITITEIGSLSSQIGLDSRYSGTHFMWVESTELFQWGSGQGMHQWQEYRKSGLTLKIKPK